MDSQQQVFDYVIIGSGFGGSVSALRLVEKGYSVLVLERGKRFRDEDFAKSNWAFWKYLWNPALKSYGIFQMSLLSGTLALHGAGVGGGSLGYGNVLMEPSDDLFAAPAWKHLADWKTVLQPHYQTAKRMLGVVQNPKLYEADHLLQGIAAGLGYGDTFTPTDVGIFFGEPGAEGQEYEDPFFGGEGPSRNTCQFCGGCMVGCRHNAKNTLVKNYLYLAEKLGLEIRPEAQVTDIRPLEGRSARFEIEYERSTSWFFKNPKTVLAHNVVLSAGALGTMKLLFRCRDVTKSLPNISPTLGNRVRTNSEELLGSTARDWKVDYSKGIAISSVFQADEVTRVEPVRYPARSGLIRLLAWPLIRHGAKPIERLFKILWELIRHPIDTLSGLLLPGWAERTTIFLVMQTEDNQMKVRFGRSIWTLFRKGLVAQPDEEKDRQIPASLDIGHKITRSFAEQSNGISAGSIAESLLGMPSTAHLIGGVSIGRNIEEGVVDLSFEVFNYPGIFVIDGSIVPANPGINPSLTITALAEYAMSKRPAKTG